MIEEFDKQKVLYVPFNISLDQAKMSIDKKWKFFSPIPLFRQKKEILENAKNVFLPAYICNVSFAGDLDIKAVNVLREWKEKENLYWEIDKANIKYKCASEYEKTLFLGTNSITENYFRMLEPFNLDLVKEEDSEAIIDDKLNNDISEDECFNKVKEKIINDVFFKIKQENDFDKYKLDNENLTITNITYQKVLLPIWVFKINYKNKTYCLAINGQTGKLVGNFPRSRLKIAIFVSIIFFIIFSITYLIAYYI